jgi:hypothetical protein
MRPVDRTRCGKLHVGDSAHPRVSRKIRPVRCPVPRASCGPLAGPSLELTVSGSADTDHGPEL